MRRIAVLTSLVVAVAALLVVPMQTWRASRTADDGLHAILAGSSAGRPIQARFAGQPWTGWAGVARAKFARPALSAEQNLYLAELELEAAHKKVPEAYERHGAALAAAGDADRAVEQLSIATDLDERRAEAWTDLSAALIARAAMPGHANDAAHALEVAERAVGLASRSPEARFNLALALENVSLREQAAQAWRDYLALEQLSPWAAEAKQHLTGLAATQSDGDAQDLREQLFDAILPEWSRTSARVAVLPPAAERVIARLDSFQADSLVHDVVAALHRADGTGSSNGFGDYGDARRLYAQGRYDEAKALFARSAAAFAGSRNPMRDWASLWSAVCDYRQGRYAQAMSAILADHARTGSRYPSLEGKQLWMMGLLHLYNGEHEKAELSYRDAVARFDTAGERKNAGFVLGLQAELADRRGQPEVAWALRLSALRQNEQYGTYLDAMSSAATAGYLLAADRFAVAAVKAAERSLRPKDIGDAYRARAGVLARLGRNRQALQLVEDARKLLTAANLITPRITAEFDFCVASFGAADAPAEAAGAAGRALQYFERAGGHIRLPDLYLAQAQAFRKLGRDRDARASLDRGLAELEAQRTTLVSRTARLTFGDQMRRIVDELVSLDLEEDDQSHAFAALDRLRAQNSRGLPDIKTMLAKLPAGSVGLVYYVGRQTTTLWILSAGAVRSTVLPVSFARLSAAAARYQRDGFPSDLQSELTGWLLSPAVRELDGAVSVTIVPDGPIGLIPFATLRGPRHRFLIEDMQVRYVPRLSAIVSGSAGHSASGAVSMAAFGNPAVDPTLGLAGLPDAELEAKEIAADYGAGATAYVEREATVAAMERAFSNSDVIHFAGHSVTDPLDPDRTFLGIENERGQVLSLATLAAPRNRRVRLFVLASCEGAGGRLSAEGPISLAQALLEAGVTAVVASLSPVEDRTSRKFFRQFHSEYRKSSDAAASLRAAQLAMIASSDNTLQTPRAWGTFVVIG